MMGADVTAANVRTNLDNESFNVHWGAVFAGIFISLLAYLALTSLGVALGAGEMRDVLRGMGNSENFGTGAGIWLLVSVLVSLFVGCYASGRVSGLVTTRVGYMQGAVVASVFFALMITEAGVAVGLATAGFLGAAKDAVTTAAGTTANNQQLNGIVEDAIGDLNLKSPPDQVAAGVLSRALRGDTDAAINYLAAQSGISRPDARSRYENLNLQVRTAAADIAQKASDAARRMGWLAFITMVLGTVCGMLGGGLGAALSIRKPLGELDRRALRFQKPVYT